MSRRFLISSLILLVIPAFAGAATLRVPKHYSTIQAALDAANDGDTIVVDPGTYSGIGNRDLKFNKKDITLKSIINPNAPLGPEDWQTIANTIIDCQGSSRNPHRAFRFSTGDNDCQVIGFTIINGYATGGKGADGQPGAGYPGANGQAICVGPEYRIDPADELSPPRACEGQMAQGDGYGGAIVCIGDSSPTIRYCTIKNCTVTGARGGDGAPGLRGVWYWPNEDPNFEDFSTEDGQWGGHGGLGRGNGYGGAIACVGYGRPVIDSCRIRDNIAKGGIGGNGGDGGMAAGTPPDDWDGYESGGGSGGVGHGDGVGGAIYCAQYNNPIIKNCTFINNIARQGQGGQPGSRGPGNAFTDLPDTMDPIDGTDGDSLCCCYSKPSYNPGIHGGAIFFEESNVDLTCCEFSNNQAYFEDEWPPGRFEYYYRTGGALYCRKLYDTVNINSCDFINNKAGAVVIDPNRLAPNPTINISNTDDPNRGLFSENTQMTNGGSIYIGPGAKVGISNCSFASNWADDDGGALYCLSDLDINKCSFGGNKADYDGDEDGGNGGAIYARGITVTMADCSFASNQAVYGGGVCFEDFETEQLENCHFFGNTAESGGGLTLIDGAATITGGSVKNNTATGAYISSYGGGIDCVSTELEIRDCEISVNSAEGDPGFGGGISLDGGPLPHLVSNCLLTNNSADTGGAISCTYSEGLAIEIESSTFYSNSANSYGGGVFVDYDSNSTIINSIFSNCSNIAIYEEDGGGRATVKYSLFFDNPNGDYYDSGTGQVYNGPGDLGSIPGGGDNKYGDPLFIDPLGLEPNDDFLLSQMPLQDANSSALDAGSVNLSDPAFDPEEFGWDPREYTTRTDGAGDVNWLDMGYHYKYGAVVSAPRYVLTTEVLAGSGYIEVSPDEPNYPLGTAVNLTAVPTSGWFIKAWHGTDDDSLTGTTNRVTMTFHRTVGVEFRQKRTFSVGIDPNYPNIQSAIFDAEDGDVVVVCPGIWYPGLEPWEGLNINKSITVRAVDPNDPTATVIYSGSHGDGIHFGSNAGPGTILDGFTIQGPGVLGGWWTGGQAPDGEDPGENGVDGACLDGLGIIIDSYASPTIRNCIIRDHRIRGGHGGDGVNADTTHNAGRGGWGGWARGAGVYCAAYSSPTFINCQIIDNEARGGNGGFGGDRLEDGGSANYGGNWSTAPGINYDGGTTWVEGNLWQVWWRNKSSWYDDASGTYRLDYFGDYRWYTAYGGGVFCNIASKVTFIDCAISGNRTSGGNSGIGGHYSGGELDRLPPRFSYQLPSYGAGVYCAADTEVKFTNCEITDNIAQEPNEYFHLEPYLGHGGGVCTEDSATVTFENCLISGNTSTVGGAVLWDHSGVRVIDSTIRNNKAYEGGGIGGVGGQVYIIGSTITNNKAFGMVTDPNAGDDVDDYDPNRDYYLPGDGGGIFCDTAHAHILDCNISDNIAGGAGGGVYFTGETQPSLFNCLLRRNTADKGGGGVAAHYLAQPTIANCTITKNQASGDYFDLHYGGGLYSFDSANTSVINSILWGNSAGLGPQIAVGRAPAGVDVTYSDVHGGAVGVFIDTGCTLNWGDGNLEGTTDDKPDFVHGDLGVFGNAGGFFLAQLAGEGDQSPCVNRGSGNAHELGMYRHTTRTDGLIDGYDYTTEPNATVDIGYHYILKSNLAGDFNYDGIVDGNDLERLLDPNLHWLEEGCQFPDYCHGKDLDKDGSVNFKDYAIFAKNYKAWEKIPPQPDPMTWETPPFSLTNNSIKMVATEATDNSTVNIEYQFKCVFSNDPCYTPVDHCKDWSLDHIYIDTVQEGYKYGYQVRARDESDNETGWSFVGYAIAGQTAPDEEPPGPISWEREPYGSAEDAISMEAAEATDQSAPVEYLFQFVQDDVIEGSSGWQTERTWEYQSDTLAADTCYCCFRFKARDALLNESNWSSGLEGCTLESGGGEDISPPVTPLVDPVNQDPYDPNQAWFAVWPYETTSGEHYMQAVEATDDTGPVEYYFECQVGSAPDRDWDIDPIYHLFWNSPCSYRVKTRDSAVPPNEGKWSPAGYTGDPGPPP